MRGIRTAAIIAALGLLGLAASGAQATGGATSVAITGASALSIGSVAPSAFAGITLSGVDQFTYASLPGIDLADARGTGQGWRVTMSASQFACAAGTGSCPTGGDVLPAGLLKISAPTLVCTSGETACANARTAAPAPVVTGEVAIDSNAANAGTTIARATAGTGMGKYTLTPGRFANDASKTLQLQLPAYAYASTYSSTLTIDYVSGPQ